jgi:hypothetical protein
LLHAELNQPPIVERIRDVPELWGIPEKAHKKHNRTPCIRFLLPFVSVLVRLVLRFRFIGQSRIADCAMKMIEAYFKYILSAFFISACGFLPFKIYVIAGQRHRINNPRSPQGMT